MNLRDPEHAALLQRFRDKGVEPRPGEIAATVMFKNRTNGILAAFPGMAVECLVKVTDNFEKFGELEETEECARKIHDNAVASLLLGLVHGLLGPEARQQFANHLLSLEGGEG
jgi:hypothetical protein